MKQGLFWAGMMGICLIIYLIPKGRTKNTEKAIQFVIKQYTDDKQKKDSLIIKAIDSFDLDDKETEQVCLFFYQ